MGKKEEHNGHIKNGAKKNEFLDRKIATYDTEKCISFVLSNKTNICNLAKCGANKHFYHTIMHATFVSEVCVHISVLLLKQNIC
jgi:hypothetical protein